MDKHESNRMYRDKYGGLPKAVPKQHKSIPTRRKDKKWQSELRKLQTYRMTEKWQEKCRQVKDRDDHACKICGSMERLEVHHLTYCNVFDEPLHHLITVCYECHVGRGGSIHYDNFGKRRRDWKAHNPKPVLNGLTSDGTGNPVCLSKPILGSAPEGWEDCFKEGHMPDYVKGNSTPVTEKERSDEMPKV